MKIILNSELETFKHFRDTEKNFAEISIVSEKDKAIAKTEEAKAKFNNSLIGVKKKASQSICPDYKFFYKFNEGVTNKVTRALSINYFLNNKVN
jgi:hypothetical protein